MVAIKLDRRKRLTGSIELEEREWTAHHVLDHQTCENVRTVDVGMVTMATVNSRLSIINVH